MTSFQLYNHRANNKFTVVYGKMTEWSKVCDSSESLPLIRGFSSASAGVGSNPTLVKFFVFSFKNLNPSVSGLHALPLEDLI